MKSIVIDSPDRQPASGVILVYPHNEGGVVAWNDGHDRREFPTWDAAEAFALELREGGAT